MPDTACKVHMPHIVARSLNNPNSLPSCFKTAEKKIKLCLDLSADIPQWKRTSRCRNPTRLHIEHIGPTRERSAQTTLQRVTNRSPLLDVEMQQFEGIFHRCSRPPVIVRVKTTTSCQCPVVFSATSSESPRPVPVPVRFFDTMAPHKYKKEEREAPTCFIACANEYLSLGRNVPVTGVCDTPCYML
jgi:hypothetical protein